MKLLTAILLVVALFAIPVPAQTTRPARDFSKVILWAPCVKNKPEIKRGYDPRILKGGFSGWAKIIIDPVVKVGCKRVMVWLPGGTHTKKDDFFEFDGMIEASNEKLIDPAEFVKTFRPYRDKGIEIIAYTGDMRHNTRMRTLPPEQKLELIAQAFKPFLEAKCSIGFDASVEYEADSVEYHALMLVAGLAKSYGGKVYVEHPGAASLPHYAGFGALGLESMVPAKRFNNEMLVPVGPPEGEDFNAVSVRRWMWKEIERVQGLGYTPVAELNTLANDARLRGQ
jgi:hypothetical protein